MLPHARDLFSADLLRKEEPEDILSPHLLQEIMNPLCAITLSASYLRAKLGPHLGPELAAHLERVDRNAAKLARVLEERFDLQATAIH